MVTIVPERGVSPLNDLAYDLRRSFGASVDLIPERSKHAAGLYNERERRLMLTGLDQPEFFPVALHETRHSWYSALLERGEVRLFHMRVRAKRGRELAPQAGAYGSFLVLEELSTFPKTLKHLLTERAKLGADGAASLEKSMGVRALQLLDIMTTADFVSREVEVALARRVQPRRLTPSELAEAGLRPLPGMDYYELELPQAFLYFPVPRRGKKALSSAAEARTALRLRAELILALVEASVGPVFAYQNAVRARDWSAASAAADRLIKAVGGAEAAWAARSPHRYLKN